MEVRLKFKETQTIQCPTQKSFKQHINVFDEIGLIGKKHNCRMRWEILNKKEKTFRMHIEGFKKSDQLNAMIEVMEMLHHRKIEPAVIIKDKDLMKTNENVEEAINLIEEELYGTTA